MGSPPSLLEGSPRRLRLARWLAVLLAAGGVHAGAAAAQDPVSVAISPQYQADSGVAAAATQQAAAAVDAAQATAQAAIDAAAAQAPAAPAIHVGTPSVTENP